MTRFLPNAALRQPYAFLTRHSARSMLTYTTYDFAAAPFDRTLRIKHELPFAPLVDGWTATHPSATGNAVVDFPSNIEGITQMPHNRYDGSFSEGGLGGIVEQDAYYASADSQYVYVHIEHNDNSLTGIHHVYFHLKLYLDDFEAPLVIGEQWDGSYTPK